MLQGRRCFLLVPQKVFVEVLKLLLKAEHGAAGVIDLNILLLKIYFVLSDDIFVLLDLAFIVEAHARHLLRNLFAARFSTLKLTLQDLLNQ